MDHFRNQLTRTHAAGIVRALGRSTRRGLVLLLLLGVGLVGASFVLADEQQPSSAEAGLSGFQDFLRFEGRLPTANRLPPRAAVACPSGSGYEVALPRLAPWISRLGLKRAPQAGQPVRDDTVVLSGTGYNYQRSKRVTENPGRP